MTKRPCVFWLLRHAETTRQKWRPSILFERHVRGVSLIIVFYHFHAPNPKKPRKVKNLMFVCYLFSLGSVLNCCCFSILDFPQICLFVFQMFLPQLLWSLGDHDKMYPAQNLRWHLWAIFVACPRPYFCLGVLENGGYLSDVSETYIGST